MEPDLRNGQRCCEEVSPRATGQGGQRGLNVVEHKGMLEREKSFVSQPCSFLFSITEILCLEPEMRVLSENGALFPSAAIVSGSINSGP